MSAAPCPASSPRGVLRDHVGKLCRRAGYAAAVLACTSMTLACGDDPTDPVPEEPMGPFAVSVTLAAEAAEGAGQGVAWVLWDGTGDRVTEGEVLLGAGNDTVIALDLERGTYVLEWLDRIIGRVRYRLEPTQRISIFEVRDSMSHDASTSYEITTGAISVSVLGIPADAVIRWSLTTPDGECVRCFNPLAGNSEIPVDLMEPGDYEVSWTPEDWYDVGRFSYHLAPRDTVQAVRVETGSLVHVETTYEVIRGTFLFWIEGLPLETALTAHLHSIAAPDGSVTYRSESLQVAPEGAVSSWPYQVGRWGVAWPEVDVNGTIYAPEADSVEVEMLPVYLPTEVRVRYAPK